MAPMREWEPWGRARLGAPARSLTSDGDPVPSRARSVPGAVHSSLTADPPAPPAPPATPPEVPR